jgi:class 3 adenylate cyclase/tetratricopeptide (TPR) repeat protein
MADRTEPVVGARPASVERRIVTVLFADLVGFTPLSERLDAEDIATVQDAYFAGVRETIARYGGVLEKFIGDAAMAVFGIPRARDDDADCAVRAGLALIGSVEQLGARLGLEPGELQLRVGINSGEVVHATDGPNAGRVTGDTVNTAARLQVAARPNAVLLGELTALAVEEAVDLDDAQPVTLKGKAEPVRARAARGIRPLPSRDEAMRGLRAPILGRDHELARLEAVATGRITIVAPPGVGKSRLLAELAARLTARGGRVLRTRVRPQATDPYEPVADLLRAAGATDALTAALLEAGMPPGRATVVEAEVAELLGTGPGRATSLGDVAEERERRFASWIDALDALTGKQRAAWIVEDVHWAGADLLAFLARAATHGRAVVYASARPAILDVAAAWTAEGERLDLGPLPAADGAALIRALIGEALPDTIVDAITERSDGNPLFIEELLRTWVSVGTLVREGGRWSLAVAPEAVTLPPTVQAIYAAQLDDLPADARLVARRASVIGRRFAEAALGPLELEHSQEGLTGLRHRALIDGPQADAVSGSVYAYRHALLRDAGYASLARAERARLHLALARWMEETAGDGADAIAEAIGGHHAAVLESLPALVSPGGPERATIAADAAAWLTRGAERALSLAAHDRAIELLEWAIGITPPDDELRIAERRLRLGEVMAPVADLDRGIAEIRAALDGFGRHLPDARTEYLRAAHALGSALMQQISFDEASDVTASALAAVAPADDAATARVLALHAFADAARGERDGVLDALARAEAIGAAIGDPELDLDLMAYRSSIAGDRDDVEPTDPSRLEGAARTLGRWRLVAGALRMHASELGRAHPRDALPVLEAAEEVCRTHGLSEQLGWTRYAQAETRFTLGEWDEANRLGLEAIGLAERFAYVRVAFRTWMILLPIAAARGDASLLPRFDRWWAEAVIHLPATRSPYAEVLQAARSRWLPAARREEAPPIPASVVAATERFDANPHSLDALATIAAAWLHGPEPQLEAARTLRDHLRAEDDPAWPLVGSTARLVAAWVAAAQGDASAANRLAGEAAELAAAVDAPWWRLRALEVIGAPDEAAAIAAQLGISAARGSSRVPVPPRDG